MFYRNIAFLLIAGAVSFMLVSKITAHSGLTFTSPSRTVYVPFNLVLSWLSLTVCSLVASALMPVSSTASSTHTSGSDPPKPSVAVYFTCI